MGSAVIIDASLAIFSVLNLPQSETAAQSLSLLANQGYQFHAPGLWWHEVTSVIHRYHYAGAITDHIAYQALDLLTVAFEVQLVNVSYRNAFNWATRLRQKAAYNGFYLAAAEQLEAEMWTADRELANNARQLGAGWVHWMGE
jgi:predicted nucleic acid-binding protein